MGKLTSVSIISILALSFFIGISFADTETKGKGVWVDGELISRASSLENYKGSGVLDRSALSRALISLGANFADDISASLLFGKIRVWGKSASTYQVEEPGASEFLSGSPGFLENLGIYNAYFKVDDVVSGLDLTLGRQFAGDEEDAFFFYGPQYGRFLGVTSLDAVKGEWSWGQVNLMALGGKKIESGIGDGSGINPDYPDPDSTTKYIEDMDTNIFALRAKSTTLVTGQNFEADIYNRRRGLPDRNKVDNLFLYVLRSRGDIPQVKGLEYDAMVGINSGKNEETDQYYRGWLSRIIGYYNLDVSSLAYLKFTGGYVYVSGDKASTSGKDEHFARMSRDCFYGMALITYAILNDVPPESVTNVTIPFGGIDIAPEFLGKKVTLTVMACDLDCPQPIAGYDEKGSEVNVALEYAPSDDIFLGLSWAEFRPRGILESLWGSSSITQITGVVMVNF